MKKYYSRTETPLIFHKIFWYALLPLGFFGGIYNMVKEIQQMPFYNWLYGVDICFYLVTISLALVCFIGFFKWKPYAWYCLIIRLSFTLFNYILAAVITTIYDPDKMAFSIGQVFGILIFTVLIGIYYIKRRPLFFQNAQNEVGTPYTTAQGVTAYYTAPQVKFCRKCGNSLESDSIFCSQCGTPVVKE